ncbi:hypothetical protein C8R46DRAFT_1206904 [Mycena filopes]|nr:hypothetical protein C8R46DRAFT_1206904 [Mycena filopes]
MVGAKPKRTIEEVRERRADAAWRYRQRKKVEVNLKARERMQRRREQLKTAPSDVQLEHTVQAAQYRRRYKERSAEKHVVQPVTKIKKTKVLLPSPPMASAQTPKARSAPKTPNKVPPKSVALAAQQVVKKKKKMAKAANNGAVHTTRRVFISEPRLARGSPTPTPRSLTAIAAAESDQEDSSDDAYGFDGDDRRNLFGLSPAVLATAEPGYIPQRGQQPIVRNGRRYWF